MFVIENILDNEDVKNIVSLIDLEIENNFDVNVPLYQSHTNMHLKYDENESFKKFLKKVDDITKTEMRERITLIECWFNICKKDSNFEFHNHIRTRSTENGTIFKINNALLQLKVKDNDLVFFDPSLLHTVPPWKNIDRYSIAMDFIER
jgi:hypothetical protein